MKRMSLLVLLLVLVYSLPALASTLPFEEDGSISISGEAVSVSEEGDIAPPAARVETTAAAAEAPKAPEPKPTKTHKVAPGDTLWGLAQKYLGDGKRFWEIVKANASKFPTLAKNPDLILDGWELIIPEDEKKEEAKPADTAAAPDAQTPAAADPAKPATSDAKEPAKSKPLTVAQKTKKLQDAVTAMNRYLLKKGLTMTELNEATVREMINLGIITEEEWMSLTPPDGMRWVIKNNDVILVNRDGNPITNDEAKAAEEKSNLAEKAKEAAKEAVKKAQEAVETAKKAAEEALKKAKEQKDKAAQDEAKKKADEAKAAEEAKQLAEKEAAKKEAEAKAAAEKAKKEAEAKAAAEKAEKEAKSRGEQNFLNDLKAMKMPNIADQRKEYDKAIWDATRFLPATFWKASPFYKFTDGPKHLVILQNQLLEAQKLYEKKVREQDTDKFLGIWGDNIESAAKKVKEAKGKLQEAWNEAQAVFAQAKEKATGLESEIKANNTEIASIKKELAKIDQYNPDNGPKVQELLGKVRTCEAKIKDRQEQLENYAKIKALFRL